MIEYVEIIDRARTGKRCSADEWDTQIVPGVVNELLKKYRIEKVYDPDNPVNSDDELADAFFEAGLDLAERTGFFCETTGRVIAFSRDEIIEAMKEDIPYIDFGTHPDQRTLWARRPEDPRPPFGFLGPLGEVTDEELYLPIHQSVAQYRVVDGLLPGTLAKLQGRRIRTRTPIET